MNHGLDRHRQVLDALILPPGIAIPGAGGSAYAQLATGLRGGGASLTRNLPASGLLSGVA